MLYFCCNVSGKLCYQACTGPIKPDEQTDLILLSMVLGKDTHNRHNCSGKATWSISATHCPDPTCKHTVVYKPLLYRVSNRIYVLSGFSFLLLIYILYLFNKEHVLFPVLFFTYLNLKRKCLLLP